MSKEQAGCSAGVGAKTAASRWRELHGEQWWEGLLRPLDLELRRTVIWYGEMAQATYDAFNNVELSPHASLCRYARRRFFERVMLPGHAAAYRVIRFLYAPGSGGRWCNWIGYLAVATDEGKAALGRRDIVVAWRGTALPLELADDRLVVPPRGLLSDGGAMVHRGWLSMYTASKHDHNSARDQVLRMVRTLVDTYKEEEVSITVMGHGIGAALATLSAFDIAENSYSTAMRAESAGVVEFPVTAFAFASPRVGDASCESATSAC